MIKTLRLAAMAALLCLALPAGADSNVRGRVNHPAHANFTGLQIPHKAGACTTVTGQGQFDLCGDSTNNVLYACDSTSCVAVGSAMPSQILPTVDPATTGASDASIYWATTAFETDDKAWAVGAVSSMDKEGDLVCVKATVSGQAAFSANPADTTAANASVLVTVTGHASNELAIATSDGAFTVDKEGDAKVLTLTIGSTAVTATGTEINKLAGLATTTGELGKLNLAPIGTHTISCADDAAGTTSLCTVQLVNTAGADMAVRSMVYIYLSDDAAGDSIVATAPSGGWVVTTDGLLMSVVTNKAAFFVSESDGDIDFTITEAGAKTLYVILVDQLGRLIASSALDFN